jgi:hypothetical protein
MNLHPPRKPLSIAWAAVLAAATLACGPAAAQSSVDAPPNFPGSLDRDVLVGWLKRETDIPPESVVAVSPSAITSLMSTRVMVKPPGFSVALRAEALSPEVFTREGSLSWNTAIDVDCARRRIRQGPTTGYAARNLLYTGKPVRPADRDWMAPPAGSTLDSVWRAVCDKAFQRPLAGPEVAGAKPPVVAAEVAPPIAPPKPAPPKPALPGPAPPPAVALRPSVSPRPVPPPVAADAEPSRPATLPSIAAQLSASSTEAAANQSLAAARRRYAEQMQNRTTRVARAVVGGKVYFRALVQGFTSAADAQGFCRSLNVTGQPCFVRPGGGKD